MKSLKLIVVAGACSLLLSSSAAVAGPVEHSKAIASAPVKKTHAAKADRKGPALKRPVHHDSTLDYPQLG